jgi:hypothetical protein
VPDFEVSQYLITNAEFLEFVKAGGYDNQSLWTEEGSTCVFPFRHELQVACFVSSLVLPIRSVLSRHKLLSHFLLPLATFRLALALIPSSQAPCLLGLPGWLQVWLRLNLGRT